MNKILAVSNSIYQESEYSLINMGYKLIKIPSVVGFEEPVSSHPDMFISKVGERAFYDLALGRLFTNCSNFSEKARFIECGREADPINLGKYPNNIEFNCVNVGKFLFCNKNYTNKRILEFAVNNGITVIDVNQGYAKCSTCVVSDKAIITEDVSIEKKAKELGIDVLFVEKGHVSLSGYDYGFIGGCSGLIENSILAFNGNVNLHPQFDLIDEFCRMHQVEIVSLCNRKLMDIGTIMRIL